MSSISFGVSLPSAGAMASAQNIRTVAEAAERLGYDSVWVSDHIVAPAEFKSVYPYGGGGPFSTPGSSTYYDPLVTLAWIAGATQRVRLGVSVLVVPLRNPVYAGKLIASLDALSGGRVTMGVGVGWLREEFDVVAAPEFDHRGQVTDEWIAIWRALWADDPVSSFDGEHYRVPPVESFPKPVQRPAGRDQRWPGPPIWVGGNSKAALRRVARLGDGWQGLRMNLDEFQRCLPELDEQLRAVGRSRESIAVSSRLNLRHGPAQSGDTDWDVAGDPQFAAERVRSFVKAGTRDFLALAQPRESIAGMVETLEWFAKDVRPLVEVR